MKVLLINGSPKEHGNTFQALTEDGHPQKEQPIWTNFIR